VKWPSRLGKERVSICLGQLLPYREAGPKFVGATEFASYRLHPRTFLDLPDRAVCRSAPSGQFVKNDIDFFWFSQGFEARAPLDRVLIGYFSDALERVPGWAHTASVIERPSFLCAHRPGLVAPPVAACKVATPAQLNDGRPHVVAGVDIVVSAPWAKHRPLSLWSK